MYVKRDVETECHELLELFPALLIVGPRRSGKTTLARQIGKKYDAEFIPLDDPVELEEFDKKIREFAKKHQAKTLILDEAQYAERAGPNIKYLVDVEEKRIIATGSSAHLVSKSIISYLVGRTGIIELYPFSMSEILRAKRIEYAYQEEQAEILREYTVYGGFPEVVLQENIKRKKKILKHLLITAVERDAARIAETTEREVMRTVTALAATKGNIIEYSSIANTVGIEYRKLRRIIDALESAYLIYLARPFHTNKMNELRKAPKVYFIDSGIKHAVEERFSDIITGDDMETVILSELLKMGFKPKYWRTKNKAEVDFIIEHGRKLIAIEVKTVWTKGIPSGLRSFIERYGENVEKALIVDGTVGERTADISNTLVKKIPVWKLRDELAGISQ